MLTFFFLSSRIIDINLMSHFWMAKAFLPDMIGLSRGHIVTVSSVLGYIAPAGLCKCRISFLLNGAFLTFLVASYCASKAGLVAFHDCLTHEVKKSGVKTLLVTPGQMNSDLFKGVSTPNSFFAPVVSTLEFAEKIVNAIEDGRCGEIAEPFYAKLVPFSRLMPQSVLEMLRGIFKIDKAMETYIGEN
jgi:short-subunit dehydrogenase